MGWVNFQLAELPKWVSFGLALPAKMMKMTWDQIDGIVDRAVQRGLARRELKLPRRIGVDETSFQKRHEYVTVVSALDKEEGGVIHVDAVRREENAALRGRGNNRLVGTRYLWLKHVFSISEQHWDSFEDLRESSLKTART